MNDQLQRSCEVSHSLSSHDLSPNEEFRSVLKVPANSLIRNPFSSQLLFCSPPSCPSACPCPPCQHRDTREISPHSLCTVLASHPSRGAKGDPAGQDSCVYDQWACHVLASSHHLDAFYLQLIKLGGREDDSWGPKKASVIALDQRINTTYTLLPAWPLLTSETSEWLCFPRKSDLCKIPSKATCLPSRPPWFPPASEATGRMEPGVVALPSSGDEEALPGAQTRRKKSELPFPPLPTSSTCVETHIVSILKSLTVAGGSSNTHIHLQDSGLIVRQGRL